MRSRIKEAGIPILGTVVMLGFTFTTSIYLGAVEQGIVANRANAQSLEAAIRAARQRRNADPMIPPESLDQAPALRVDWAEPEPDHDA